MNEWSSMPKGKRVIIDGKEMIVTKSVYRRDRDEHGKPSFPNISIELVTTSSIRCK